MVCSELLVVHRGKLRGSGGMGLVRGPRENTGWNQVVRPPGQHHLPLACLAGGHPAHVSSHLSQPFLVVLLFLPPVL